MTEAQQRIAVLEAKVTFLEQQHTAALMRVQEAAQAVDKMSDSLRSRMEQDRLAIHDLRTRMEIMDRKQQEASSRWWQLALSAAPGVGALVWAALQP